MRPEVHPFSASPYKKIAPKTVHGNVVLLRQKPDVFFGGSSNSTDAGKPGLFSRLLNPFRNLWRRFTGFFKSSASQVSQNLQTKIDELKQKVQNLQKKADGLQTDKTNLEKEKQDLEEKIQTQEEIYRDIPSLRTPEQIQKDRETLKQQVEAKLSYDATNAPKRPVLDPLAGKKKITVTKKTASKSTVSPLKKPSMRDIENLANGDGKVVLKVTGSPESLDKQADCAIGSDSPNGLDQVEETDYTFDYNLKWSLTKSVRDLFQNFADSHGGTLGGTDIKATCSRDGTYTVRVKGQGEYHYDYVRRMMSSKGDSSDTAGGFGEGAKIMPLSFIRDHQAESVTYSSRDWMLEYKEGTAKVARINKKMLVRTLKKKTDEAGNYVEIKTKNPNLVSAIFNGVDLFYHPANPDFQNPTVDNEVGGFRYLGKAKAGSANKGNIYSARQRYEYGKPDKWEQGLDFVTLWTHQNILKTQGTADRDRLHLDGSTVATLARSIAEKMTDEELMQAIFSLQEIWADSDVWNALKHTQRSEWSILNHSAGRVLLKTMLDVAGNHDWILSKNRNLGAEFSKEYLADTGGISDGVKLFLLNAGYKLCPKEFASIGMKEAKEKYREISAHQPVQPQKSEVMRINILKEAARILAQYPEINSARTQSYLQSKGLIGEADIQKPIYIFDNKANRDTNGVLAEYAGTHIWLDKTYLNKATFGQALGTYFHEMLHKVAGDGSSEFGYALTELLEGHLDTILKLKREDIQKLQDLQALWSSIK